MRGTGKSYIGNLLSQKINFEVSVSHTTRNPRQSEIQNKDYFVIYETD